MTEQQMPSPVLADSAEVWAQSLESGRRKTLSSLLSFSESAREDHRALVEQVLDRLPRRGAHRIGLTGVPGAGKSCLIEALGTHFLNQGQMVAALTIDPSSQLSGGSILGDKLRMPRLGSAQNAFVRGVASQGMYGGLAPGVSQAVSLLDRAGYDIIFVESVGVGQSELDIALLVDCLVLVLSPTDGDDVQGMKRGITEIVDLVVVNKCDHDPNLAAHTASRYANALGLMRGEVVRSHEVSAISGHGVAELSGTIVHLSQESRSSTTRVRKDAHLGEKEARVQNLLAHLVARTALSRARLAMDAQEGPVREIVRRVEAGSLAPNEAVSKLLRLCGSDF